MKLTKLFLFFAFIAISLIQVSPKNNKLSAAGQLNQQFLHIQKALATTTLDPANINGATIAGRADLIRYLYFLTVGTSAEYTIPNLPEGGLVGIISTLTGAQGIGGIMYNLGYTTCADIPNSDSTTITGDDGEVYVFTYGNPTKTIPSHFGSFGGTAFTKRVAVTRDSANFITAELNCESNGLVSGYLRVLFPDDNRGLETYFLRDTDAQDGYMDFYTTYTGSTYSEKLAVQFNTTDEDTFNLYLFRNQDNSSGNDNGAAFGIKGTKSTGLVSAYYVFDEDTNLNDATAITSGLNECIDMTTNTAGSGCTAISAPTNVTLGAAFSWTINSLQSLTLSNF